jgi:hypothetical protein
MGTCSAVRSSFVEVACICMCAKYHVTRSVDNAIIGVCGNVVEVVEERFHELFHVYCCLSLSCSNGIECYQQLIVDSSCIIQEGSDNFLNTLDSGDRGADVSLSGVHCVFWPYAMVLQ